MWLLIVSRKIEFASMIGGEKMPVDPRDPHKVHLQTLSHKTVFVVPVDGTNATFGYSSRTVGGWRVDDPTAKAIISSNFWSKGPLKPRLRQRWRLTKSTRK